MCDGMYTVMISFDLLDFFYQWSCCGIQWIQDDELCGALCYLIAIGIPHSDAVSTSERSCNPNPYSTCDGRHDPNPNPNPDSVGIYAVLMGGNTIFINAMQNCNEVRLRSCIVGNLTFGILVLVMLISTAITGHGGTNNSNKLAAGFVWFMRVGVVLCYVVVGLYYTRLWNVYHPDSEIW